MKRGTFITWIFLTLSLISQPLAMSGEKPGEEGHAHDREGGCMGLVNGFRHGALKYFHMELCRLNAGFPAIAEETLRHVFFDMGASPDLSALPVDGTPLKLTSRNVKEHVVSGNIAKVVAPDSFAGTYDYVLNLFADDVQHLKMYFSGTNKQSKGFLILGGRGFSAIGQKRLLYLRWDRKDPANQQVNVLGTRIAPNGSYLADGREEDAIYGSLSFNASTKQADLYMVYIGSRRGGQVGSSVPACFRMSVTGTLGGTVTVSKTKDGFADVGHPLSDSSRDGKTDMDSATVVDDAGTADGTGVSSTAPGRTMNYSCADLAGAADAGKPFEGSTVNYGITKAQVDVLFGSN